MTEKNVLTVQRGLKRAFFPSAALAIAVASATPVLGQTAYFSTQGDFLSTSPLQDFFINTSRTITPAETLRFETFSHRGTANAAGDNSPTSPSVFDSLLTLTNTFGGAGPFNNDDGAAINFRDANLTWAGVAPNGGGTLGPSLASSLFGLRLNEFNNEAGPWGVDLVGPADAMRFTGFASAGGQSIMRSIKFGTDAAASLVAPASEHARFQHSTNSAYAITGQFVVGQTGNASYIGDSTTGGSLTVGLETRVNLGGDITLSGNSVLNANGGFIVNGGRAVLSGTSRINIDPSTTFIDITDGGRMDVNAGATFDAPGSRLDLGFGGSAAENLLVVVNGVVNTRQSFIGESAGSRGRATINGANGRWNLTEDLIVGGSGQGFFEVTTGARVVNGFGYVGFRAGSVGTAFVTENGVWTNTGDLELGRSDGTSTGTGTVTLGGRLNIGDASTSVSVTGIVISDLVGTEGGTLRIFAGSTLTNASGGISRIGLNGGYGAVTVSGTNARFLHTNGSGLAVAVDPNATGFLNVLAGGTVEAPDIIVGGFGGVGTINVSGSGSVLKLSNNMTLSSSAGAGTGIVTLANGGELLIGDSAVGGIPGTIDVSDADPFAANAGGLLTIRNGSTVTTPGVVLIGRSQNTFGRLLVTGNASTLTGGTIFAGNRGTGDIRVEAGGDVVTGQFVVAAEAGGNGTSTVTGAGSTVTAGFLDVGSRSTGLLTISSGGRVNVANAANIGEFAAGVGTITLSDAGSTLDVTGDMRVGSGGRGIVNLNGGAAILVGNAVTGTQDLQIADANLAGNAGGNVVLNNQSTWTMNNVVFLALPANTHGRLAVNGAGSTFSTNSVMVVGGLGAGVLDVNAGGRVTLNGASNGTELTLGFNAGGRGTVTVDGAGSVLEVDNNVHVGAFGGNAVSTLTVRNGGLLIVGDTPTPTQLPPAISVFVADNTLDGSAGGIIDIRPGSLLDSAGDVYIATLPATFGRVNVSGANARVKAANIVVGLNGGTGRLDVTAGGRAEPTAGLIVFNGVANVTGADATIDGANVFVGPPIGAGVGVMNISAGGRVKAATSFGILAGSKVDVGTGGRLEIGSSGTPLATIRGYLQTGYAGGTWTGNGITSNAGQADPRVGLGYYLDSVASVINIYNTLRGDATGDFTVNFADLVALAQNYNGTGKVWQQGDFNYDANVNFADLVALAQNYNQALSAPQAEAVGSAFAADYALAISLVPEPGICAVGVAVALGATRRRRSASSGA